MNNVVVRKSCRAILLTPEREILLIKIGNPTSNWAGWITPGGGLDEGESEVEGLKRELREELGLIDFKNPVKIWKRSHSFVWNGSQIEQSEIYFLVKTEKFQPSSATNLTEAEVADFKELRWWRLDDIQASQENFAPTRIGPFVEKLLAEGEPVELIDVGV